MTLLKKSQQGQFNTTNVDYILQEFTQKIIKKDVIDPFCGKRDLLNWAEKHGASSVFGIDIDIDLEEADAHANSFIDPFDYTNAFILANPPYLAKNKSNDKSIFSIFKTDDLYKAAIQTFGECAEGILIIPVNFLSSRESKTREWFFSKFTIEKCVLFEEQVFDDTPSTVISFYFKKGKNTSFPLLCMPSTKKIDVFLNPKHKYLFGEDFFNFIDTPPVCKVRRLLINDPAPISNLYLNALDGGSAHNRIKLEIKEHYYGKQTDRAKASIVLDCVLSKEEEKEVCNIFNEKLEYFREKYHSLFLSNYRQSSSLYARKRIGFEQAYKLINKCVQIIKNIS
jgi:hypothetical protein